VVERFCTASQTNPKNFQRDSFRDLLCGLSLRWRPGKGRGPNLATIRRWDPDQMLSKILDPNREVAPNFVFYTVGTKYGRTLGGLIAEEGVASLTLKRAERVTEAVLHHDVAQLSCSGLSLMPEGLESAFTADQLAALIAFLLLPP